MQVDQQIFSADLLFRIIQCAASGIVVTNAALKDNPIVFANQAFYEMTGYSPEETIGSNCRFLQAADTAQPEIAELRASVAVNRACSVTMRNYRKSGEMFWNELHINPFLDVSSGINYFIGVQHDVTADVEFRHQREMYNAGLLHDIKGPLYGQARIFEYLNKALPQSASLDETKKALLESLVSSSKFIDKTLGLYKLENEVVTLKFSSFGAKNLAMRVFADAQNEAADKNVKLEILEPGGDCFVQGDFDMAYRALKNLVDNALKHCRKGGSIWIFASHTASSSVLAVMDEGGGLPTDLKNLLLANSANLQSAFVSRDRESTGLGLMTCAQIMRLHNGSLSLLKSDASGTDLALVFPRLNDQAITESA